MGVEVSSVPLSLTTPQGLAAERHDRVEFTRHPPRNPNQITRPTLAQPVTLPGMDDRRQVR
jgi:hypothetical protein